MENQSMLTCVSCENAFDPAPHGGFCPECDTPHPDFERPDADDGDAEDGTETDADEEPDEADVDAAESGDEDEGDGDDDGEAEEALEGDAEEGGDDAEVDDEAVDDGDEEADSDAQEAGEDEQAVEEDDETTPAMVDCHSCGTTVDASASFCPDCGTDLDVEAENEELSACPDCGTDVDDESYCPDCGTDLDAVRARLGSDDGAVPGEITLVISGESYSFGDGDTFGRQDQDWLEALVSASGGREEVKYISGEHLEFSIEDDGVYVIDVSTNGTSLNGEAVDGGRVQIEDGDTLTLAGRADIQVER